ncbi:hypothetical protein Tco_1360766 [Tanacetum coccineum]
MSWWGGGDCGVAAAVVEAKDGDGGCDDGVLWMTMVERGGCDGVSWWGDEGDVDAAGGGGGSGGRWPEKMGAPKNLKRSVVVLGLVMGYPGKVDPCTFIVDPSIAFSVDDPTKLMVFVPLVNALPLSNPRPTLQLDDF